MSSIVNNNNEQEKPTLSNQIRYSIEGIRVWILTIGSFFICLGLASVYLFLKEKYDIQFSSSVSIFGGLVVLFSVLITSVIVYAWEDVSSAESDLVNENTLLKELRRNADTDELKDVGGKEVVKAIDTYKQRAVNEEWEYISKLKNGRGEPLTQQLLFEVRKKIHSLNLTTEKQLVDYADMIETLRSHNEFRSNRLSRSSPKIKDVCWVIILNLSIICIANSFCLSDYQKTEKNDNYFRFFGNAFILSIIPFVIVLCLCLTLYLDSPFNGELKIDKELYTK